MRRLTVLPALIAGLFLGSSPMQALGGGADGDSAPRASERKADVPWKAGVEAFVAGNLTEATRLEEACAERGDAVCVRLSASLRAYGDVDVRFETTGFEPRDLERLEVLERDICPGRRSALTARAQLQLARNPPWGRAGRFRAAVLGSIQERCVAGSPAPRRGGAVLQDAETGFRFSLPGMAERDGVDVWRCGARDDREDAALELGCACAVLSAWPCTVGTLALPDERAVGTLHFITREGIIASVSMSVVAVRGASTRQELLDRVVRMSTVGARLDARVHGDAGEPLFEAKSLSGTFYGRAIVAGPLPVCATRLAMFPSRDGKSLVLVRIVGQVDGVASDGAERFEDALEAELLAGAELPEMWQR